MGIISRFQEIMASNINALLDRADNPEKSIREFMRSLNGDLGKVKAETASVTAEEGRAKRTLDECRSEIRKLQRYAEKAVENGSDEEALKFLDKKAALAGKEARLQAAYETAAANAAAMKQMHDKLVSDLERLQAREAELKGKLAAAEAQRKISSVRSGTSGALFGKYEEQVDAAYNEAMALAELRGGARDSLDEAFAEEMKSEAVSPEEELAALKRKVNKDR